MNKKDIEEVLADIRPSIQQDGGDVELVDIDDKKGVVFVKFRGACVGCPMASITLEHGISKELKKKVPGIKKVKAVY